MSHDSRIGSGSGVGLTAAEPERRSRSRAMRPAVAEHTAPVTSAPVSPNSSIRTKPAIAVPKIAPSVFAAYSFWNAPAIPAPPCGQEAGQRRQRGAHEQRRGREGEDREREPDQREQDRRLGEGRVDALVDRADQAERDRRDQHDDDDDELQGPVQAERPHDAVGDPAAEEPADREAAEEAGEDRGHGLARVAEHEDQLARPHDLVDEAGRAGQDEQQQQGADRHRPPRDGLGGHVRGRVPIVGAACRIRRVPDRGRPIAVRVRGGSPPAGSPRR